MRVFAQPASQLHSFRVEHGFYLSLTQATRLSNLLTTCLELYDWQNLELRNAFVGTCVSDKSRLESSDFFARFFDQDRWTPADLRVAIEVWSWLFADADEGPKEEAETRLLTSSVYVVANLNRGFLTVLHKVYRKGSF